MKTNKILKKWKTIRSTWIKNNDSWLFALEDFGIPKKVVGEIEKYEDDMMMVTREIERDYYKNEYPKVQEAVRECKNQPEFKEVSILAKQEYLARLERKLAQIGKEYLEYRKQDIPFWFRDLMLELQGYEKLRKKVKGLRMKIRRLKYKDNLSENIIAEADIAEASRKDIALLMGVKPQKKRPILVNCPFHADNDPSFAIYKEDAHCFGCGWHGDAIDFIREEKGCSFPEAVKLLCD